MFYPCFQYTEDNTSRKLYKNLIVGKEHEVYLNPTKGLNRMKAGHYAFHVEMAKAYPFIKQQFKQDICEINEVRMYNPSPCYANYPKHSPFRDIMDVW